MKVRIASLTILCLALAAIPALADYNNGPINGTTDAWTINFGYVVSDTFTSNGGPRQLNLVRRLGIPRRHDADRGLHASRNPRTARASAGPST